MLETALRNVSPYQIFLLLVIAYVLYITWLRSKYPPGPWQLPIIGNLHLLSQRLHVDLTNLARKYGPVYTVWIGPRPTVIVCSLLFGREVTVKKGAEFAGRAMDTKSMTMIFRNHADMASRSLDPKVVVMRKIALSVTKSKGAGGLPVSHVVKREVTSLIKELYRRRHHPFYPRDNVEVYVANIVMDLLYNFRFNGVNDPEFMKYTELGKKYIVAYQKCFLADFYPIFWYLQPGVRRAVYDVLVEDRIAEFYAKHEETYQEGTIRDLTDLIIRTKRELANDGDPAGQLSTMNCRMLLSNVQGGATETTLDMIIWSFVAALHNPSAQEKIHQELKNVMKHDKGTKSDLVMFEGNNPTCSHWNVPFIDTSYKPKLPYLNAFIHEVMRLCPTVPLALPHKAMVDTSIGSFLIPKDTAVMLNIYAIHRDDKIWEDASTFKPERFLTGEGHFDSSKAKDLIMFSGGPRSCIGEGLARIELFTFLANIFYNFEIRSSDFKNIPQLDEGLFGITLGVKPFLMSFNPRRMEF